MLLELHTKYPFTLSLHLPSQTEWSDVNPKIWSIKNKMLATALLFVLTSFFYFFILLLFHVVCIDIQSHPFDSRLQGILSVTVFGKWLNRTVQADVSWTIIHHAWLSTAAFIKICALQPPSLIGSWGKAIAKYEQERLTSTRGLRGISVVQGCPFSVFTETAKTVSYPLLGLLCWSNFVDECVQ